MADVITAPQLSLFVPALTRVDEWSTAGLTSRRQYWIRAQTALGLAPRGATV